MHSIFTHPVLMAVLLIILSALSFFFSASETAIISLSKIRLRHLVKQGSKRAQSIHRLLTKSDKFIASILIGNNFVNISISALATVMFVQLFGYNWGVVISTFTTTIFILILCEITPKIFATKYTEKIALFAAPVLEGLVAFLGPIVPVFTATSNFILKVLRIKPVKKAPLITEEELRMMIEIGKEEGVLSEEEKKMLHRIFEFGDIKVKDVMMPIEKVVAVDIKSSAEDLLNVFVEEGHARLPVFKDAKNNVVGIIFARDLLYILRDKGLFVPQDLMHVPCFVAQDLKVNELLMKFQAEQIQIAIVANEHKKALGLVTLEDLVEEIVGEIEEKHPHFK